MNNITIAILAAGLLVAGAILYSNGGIQLGSNWEFEESLRDSLIDPESVMIRNVVEDQDGDYCGEVNEKNRMGGYAGWKRFMAADLTSIDRGWSIRILGPEEKIPGNLWCSQDWSR